MPPTIRASSTRTLRAWCLLLLLCASVALIPYSADAALARTQRLVDHVNADTEIPLPYVTASFTPSNNSLLVVALVLKTWDSALNEDAMNVAGGGLTWTRRVSETDSDGFYGTQIWTAPVTTGASMALTLTGAAGDYNWSIHAYDYTGYNTSSPIGATAALGDVDSITLSGASALSSEVLAVYGNFGPTSINAGPSGGFTERNNINDVVASIQTQTRTNSVSTTVDWTVTGGSDKAASAIEIKEAAAAAGSRIALVKPPNNLGLVGYWSFNEGTGTKATDFSGNGNTGTLSTDGGTLPVWTNGKRGKALSFDGSTSYVEMTSTVLDAQQDITIAAWVYPTAAGLYPAIACKTGAFDQGAAKYCFYLDAASLQPRFSEGGASTDTGTALPLNTWTHVAITNSSDGHVIYQNGISIASGSGLPAPGSSADTWKIGTWTAAQGFFPGKVDEVRIYNRALGPTEVAALAKSGAVKIGASSVELQQGSTLANGLVGHWTFDGPDTQATITDRSGQNNHGYFNGGATSSAKVIGHLGQALQFDAVDDAVSFSLSQLSTYTVSLWVYPDNSDDYGALVNQDSANGIFIRDPSAGPNAGKITVFYSAGDHHNNTALPEEQWTHVTVVNDAGALTFYRNGTDDGTAVNALPFAFDAIGNDNANEAFGGKLDDVRIYNRALTPAEVAQLYKLGTVIIRP